jgi:hypothetical protein
MVLSPWWGVDIVAIAAVFYVTFFDTMLNQSTSHHARLHGHWHLVTTTTHPGVGERLLCSILVGVIFSLASVVHELGHLWALRQGGATYLELRTGAGGPRARGRGGRINPRARFRYAAAGPIASFLVCGAFILARLVLRALIPAWRSLRIVLWFDIILIVGIVGANTLVQLRWDAPIKAVERQSLVARTIAVLRRTDGSAMRAALEDLVPRAGKGMYALWIAAAAIPVGALVLALWSAAPRDVWAFIAGGIALVWELRRVPRPPQMRSHQDA